MYAIKELRQQKKLTQAELAHKLGVTQSVVAMWERDASLPNAAKLPTLADALGCTIDALYGREVAKSAGQEERG